MDLLSISSLLLTISAIFAYINYRYIKLPTTIGIMVISLIFSVILVILAKLGFESGIGVTQSLVKQIDFNQALMNGMLAFLLFAGAMHVNLNALLDNKWVVGLLASVGVIASTFMVGIVSYFIFGLFGFKIEFIYCLLFGSLISPTDPVAVMGVLKRAGATKNLETKIAGESLFNDGVAVVVFLVIFGIAVNGDPVSVEHIGKLFALEALGGALFGFIIGWIALYMLKRVDEYQVEVLITLALVAGGSSAAAMLHTSAPIAMVVAGLMIGNQGRSTAMSDRTRERLDTFWELIDEILNAVLFLIIGLEIILLSFGVTQIAAGLILAVLVLGARFIAVSVPVTLLRLRRSFHPHVIKILTWGGLRGGISVALALSIPEGPERNIIVVTTYIIVVLSILLQGLSVHKLVAFAARELEETTPQENPDRL